MAAQPAALKKYWAAKRAGKTTPKARTRTKTITKTRTRTVVAKPARRRRARGGGFGGGVPLIPLAVVAGGLAYLTGSQGPKFVTENLAKLPGVKTFGATAIAGVGLLAVDRWVKPNRYLRLAGYAGIVLAAMQVGSKGTGFKWLGDSTDSSGSYDLEGDDDVEDIEGDDDDDDDELEGDDDE
jgi:hypothetical protein